MKSNELLDAKKLVGAGAVANQVLALRKLNATLQNDNRRLRERLGSNREFAEAVIGAVQSADPFPPFKYTAPPKSKKPVVPVLKLSDWHIGEVIDANQTEGFGRFNYEIAQERIFSIVEDFLRYVEVQRSAYRIDECALFCEGDYVSGDIHYELQVTNEFPLPVQTSKAGLLLAEVIRRVASHFKTVTVYQIAADNHGRLTKKPQAKQKTTNNMNHLVYTISNVALDNVDNVRIVLGDGAKLLANVNGWKFLLEHGDGVRGWMGIPYYGFDRILGREARRRMNTQKGFHYWSVGHWHVPALIGGYLLMNGSLSGTSEFDHISGRHAPPSQLAVLVHPDHGVFNHTPFYGQI